MMFFILLLLIEVAVFTAQLADVVERAAMNGTRPEVADGALMLRREGLRQVSDGTFAEYYEPFTGEPLGSMQQSWTAAAVLDWLG